MADYQFPNSYASNESTNVGRPAPAPGKRTRTEALVPRETHLDANLDPIVEPNDTRSTIEMALPATRLSPRQIEHAQRRNPMLIRSQRFSSHLLSTADTDSAAFALDVAEKQATAGIKVDGIAGPVTLQTLFGRTPAAGRAATPEPVEEDPFAVHLLGS